MSKNRKFFIFLLWASFLAIFIFSIVGLAQNMKAVNNAEKALKEVNVATDKIYDELNKTFPGMKSVLQGLSPNPQDVYDAAKKELNKSIFLFITQNAFLIIVSAGMTFLLAKTNTLEQADESMPTSYNTTISATPLYSVSPVSLHESLTELSHTVIHGGKSYRLFKSESVKLIKMDLSNSKNIKAGQILNIKSTVHGFGVFAGKLLLGTIQNIEVEQLCKKCMAEDLAMIALAENDQADSVLIGFYDNK